MGGSISAARKSFDIQRRVQSFPVSKCSTRKTDETRGDWAPCLAVRTTGLINFCAIGLPQPSSCVCLHSIYVATRRDLLISYSIFYGINLFQAPWESGLEFSNEWLVSPKWGSYWTLPYCTMTPWYRVCPHFQPRCLHSGGASKYLHGAIQRHCGSSSSGWGRWTLCLN